MSEYQRGWDDCLAEVRKVIGERFMQSAAESSQPNLIAPEPLSEEGHPIARRLGLGKFAADHQ